MPSNHTDYKVSRILQSGYCTGQPMAKFLSECKKKWIEHSVALELEVGEKLVILLDGTGASDFKIYVDIAQHGNKCWGILAVVSEVAMETIEVDEILDRLHDTILRTIQQVKEGGTWSILRV